MCTLHVLTPGSAVGYQEHDVPPVALVQAEAAPEGHVVPALSDRQDGDDPAAVAGFTPGTWARPARA